MARVRTIDELQWIIGPLRHAVLGALEIDGESEDLGQIFARHPHLVIASNHGPTMGPLAAMSAWLEYIAKIGEGQRSFFGVTWRGFYEFPLARPVARYFSGMDRVATIAEYAARLREGPHNDFYVMPEGDHCNFGDGYEVQPFLSAGFVEIAIRARVPILLVVHQGTEFWSRAVAVPRERQPEWLETLVGRHARRLRETERVSLPRPFAGRLDRLRMCFALDRPRLTLAELSRDPPERRAQLAAEGERLRERMQAYVDLMACR